MSNKLKNYQTDRRKHSRGFNIFKTGRNFTKTQTKSERLMEGIGIWTSFYRANPHRFVKEYLQLEDELKIFQQILLYAMMHNVYFAYIASRGQGKTYLTAIFAIVKAILFPDTQIVIAAGQKSQAKEIIDKIATMRNTSPNLMREISNISTAGIDPIIEFHNGSWIRTVAARDGARGRYCPLV